MVTVEDAAIAWVKIDNKMFEILVDCEKALDFKKGKDIDMRDILASDKVFSNSKKGLLASEKEMKKIFNTADSTEVAKQIIKKGTVYLTKDFRAKQREEKKKKIIYLINRNGIDPRTNLPHPVQRIENAFAEAKIRIDDKKSAEDQLNTIISQLRTILPIKFELREISINIPSKYAGSCNQTIRQFGKVISEEWTTNGLVAVIELPAGMQQDFFEQLNSLTHGSVETKILRTR